MKHFSQKIKSMKEKKKKITSDELNQAIHKFLQNGGDIQKLPDQKNVNQNAVGSNWNNSQVSSDIRG